MGRSMLRPYIRNVLAASVAMHRFVDYLLQRNVLFDCELAAVVVLGRNVQNATIYTRNLDAHITVGRGNTDGFAR
jgi:hypothetical protein